MAVLLHLENGARIHDNEAVITYSRSGGPGGQNVNKVNTKATLKFYPDVCRSLTAEQKHRIKSVLSHKMTGEGCVVVESSRHRTQEMNRRDAVEKLGAFLDSALKKPKRRKKTRISKAIREKRLIRKKRRGEIKKQRGPIDADFN